MINPFSFWPDDPDGYFRHFFVGFMLAMFLKKGDVGILIVCVVSLVKEMADIWLIGGHADVFDIIWTFNGFGLNITLKQWLIRV